jgi:low affinity Fe/Cu permease
MDAKQKKLATIETARPVAQAILALWSDKATKADETRRDSLFALFANNSTAVVRAALNRKEMGVSKTLPDGKTRNSQYERIGEAARIFAAWSEPSLRDELSQTAATWHKLVSIATAKLAALKLKQADSERSMAAIAAVLAEEGIEPDEMLTLDAEEREEIAAKIAAAKQEAINKAEEEREEKADERRQPAKVAERWTKSYADETAGYTLDCARAILAAAEARVAAETAAADAAKAAADTRSMDDTLKQQRAAEVAKAA